MDTKGHESETVAGQVMPCPFCGGDGRLIEQDPMPPEITAAWWTVECSRATRRHYLRGNGCPVAPMAIGDTSAEALTRWNTRAKIVAHLADIFAPGGNQA
jgi:hypothetical protein